ncbi:MAG TPA: PIN domain-containing protein [Quisquiliibacterium sp.]|nr:PIN domain-containing protein [Quisquiliibacterium sp.]
MRTNHVLIDYENVQPKDLGLLEGGPFKVKVFVGANQSKIPVGIAAALQVLGANAEYVTLESSGANALDFHVAYYVGVLSAQEPAAFFHVISRDTGFDPLIRHLKGRGVLAARSETIAAMPCFRAAECTEQDDRIALVIEDLKKRKSAKPRTTKTLLTTIGARFNGQLGEQQLQALLKSLCARGLVRVDGANVTYALPA